MSIALGLGGDDDNELDDALAQLAKDKDAARQATPLGYIHPQGRFKASWDVVGMLCIIYSTISVPTWLSFNIEFPDFSAMFFWARCQPGSPPPARHPPVCVVASHRSACAGCAAGVVRRRLLHV